MTEPNITERQAQMTSVAVILAMIDGDKPGREALYEDYSAADMKRVLRWTIRIMGPAFRAFYSPETMRSKLMELASLPPEEEGND